MGDLLNRGTKDRPLWYVRFVDVDGKRKQRASNATTKPDARKFLEQIEERVRQGLVGCPRVEQQPREEAKRVIAAALEQRGQRLTITVRELSDRFLGDVAGVDGYQPPRIKDLARYRRDARSMFTARILPTIGARTAAELGPADIERLRDRLGQKLKPASVLQTLAVASKLFNWARRVGLIECANPVSGVERPRPTSTIDFLTKDEVAQLMGAARKESIESAMHNHRVRFPMVAVAIYCGLRKGELFGLRWRDVDLDGGRITVARSYRLAPKSGATRHLPLHPELATILRQWKQSCPDVEGLVLPVENSGGALRMGLANDNVALSELFAVAKCHDPADGKPWHLLRHTFASHFMMAGGSLFTLQRLLGHSTPTMTMRYSHLAPDFLKSEVARMVFAEAAPTAVVDLSERRRQKTIASAT